jgi:hypothetical protein
VRIPLRAFTMNASGVDLIDIRQVVLAFPGTGVVGIDEIEFTK